MLNIREFGAIGDGRLHYVGEWIAAKRFSSLAALRAKYPFVTDLGWSVDEAAFAAAKQALPATGGTIFFPAGHYLAAKYPWRIWQDNVRLQGEGAEQTILDVGPSVEEGLVLAPYRHVGWKEGAAREFAFSATSGARGSATLDLAKPELSAEFRPGDLVFVRNGANRFDQDFGEFNEIAAVDRGGRLTFRHPFARDYTAATFAWAGEVAADFKLPALRGWVRVQCRTGQGYFVPAAKNIVSIGENIFRVERADSNGSLLLANDGRANAPAGTVVVAGTHVGKSRSIIKVSRTTRNFSCAGLQVIGHRKALNLSNSYESVFTDSTFTRDARTGRIVGGLTIDGDGGRFARFERCRVEALPAIGMQFARSFGGVSFADCEFIDTNVAFTEFNFDCEVVRCGFSVAGNANLRNVVIAGGSCNDLRFRDNRIRARDLAVVFETVADIHSARRKRDGTVEIRGNSIEIAHVDRVFDHAAAIFAARGDNRVSTLPSLLTRAAE